MAAPILAGRLRDAREYFGFTVTEAAKALGLEPAGLERIEAGGTVKGEQLRRMSRLYRRPVAWFSGETRFQPSAGMLRMVEDLSEHDRETVLDFAEFLQGKPPEVTRAMPGEDG